jgi:hypothetical protein
MTDRDVRQARDDDTEEQEDVSGPSPADEAKENERRMEESGQENPA